MGVGRSGDDRLRPQRGEGPSRHLSGSDLYSSSLEAGWSIVSPLRKSIDLVDCLPSTVPVRGWDSDPIAFPSSEEPAVRWSQALIPTQKETPADAVAPSHKLLLRAGMVRQLNAGAYSYLPLGFRVLNKVVHIIREEMDAAGAQELLMPALQPLELWKESGRYETFGELLMQLEISGKQHMALGPTHEEVVTDIARGLIRSYKQLPMTLYQIQTKFRDEPRPRFGILRTREFLMKDAYSFDLDVEQLNGSYDAMYEAYCRIFDRCGIPYVIVEAESGPIGGDSSHEFMVPSSTGEDAVIQCLACGYAANVEKAEIGEGGPMAASAEPSPLPFQPVSTPHRKTIEEVCKFLKIDPNGSAKLLVFLADGNPVAALIRGDHEANAAKLRRAFGATTLVPADPATIQKATGAPMGFLGPVDIKIPLVIDRAIAAMSSVVVGGNEVDVHLTGVVPGRDFPLDRVLDLRNAGANDACPRCGAALSVTQGIEIGHVFKLGTKYSKAMGANVLDEKGQEIPIIMGCYGIGVNRIVASAVEAGHDDNGILWPLPIAPYQVLIVPLSLTNELVLATTREIQSAIEGAGFDVLVDDRDQRPGFKFKDADLIGVPYRVVIGERGLKDGNIEVKWRRESAARTLPVEEAGSRIVEELNGELDRMAAEVEAKKARRGSSRVQ
jgi:prolyl-tRNA synthetase